MLKTATLEVKSLTNRIGIIYTGNCGGEFGRRNAERIPDEFGRTKAVDLNLIDTIVFNTERTSLDRSVGEIQPTKHLLLGPICRNGEGAGFDVQKGKEAFEESKEEIRALFTDPDGKPLYRMVIIVHAALKGTGGGVALPLGKMLRDEVGIEFVMYQSVRPSPGECSIFQLRAADQRIQDIVDAGFVVTELDNGKAYERAPDEALMEEVYRMLDDDQVRALQAPLYVISNPGAIDVSDFKNWVIGSGEEGEGRRLMTGYASFNIEKYNDPDNEEVHTNFDTELKKAFDTWAFNFKYRSPTSALIVYYGNEFWNKGRKVKLENELQNFANKWIIPGDQKDFYPILGGQYTTDKSAGEYAFLAIMACGPKENAEFKTLLQKRQEDEERRPANLPSPVALRPLTISEQPPAAIPLPTDPLTHPVEVSAPMEAEVEAEISEPVAPQTEEQKAMSAFVARLEAKKTFLLAQLNGKTTASVRDVFAKINALDVEAFLSSNEVEGKTAAEALYLFEDKLLDLYSPAGKFTPEEYLRIKQSNRLDTLKDWSTKSEVEMFHSRVTQYEDRFAPVIKDRLAILELFSEELIQKHLARKKTTKDAPTPDKGYKELPEQEKTSAKGNGGFLSKIISGNFGGDSTPTASTAETTH